MFSIHEHDQDVPLGSGVLDSRQFYPDSFDGKVALRGAKGTGNDAHIKVKIVAESEEKQIELKMKEEQAKAKAKKKAEKKKVDETQLTPWEKQVANLSQSSQRVAPGQVLKPRGTPVYRRLYDDHLAKQERIQARVDAAQQKDDEEFEASLNKQVMRQ